MHGSARRFLSLLMLVFAAAAARAQVIYTDLGNASIPFSAMGIDLDHDGVDDVTVQATCIVIDTTASYGGVIVARQGVTILVDESAYVIGLEEGELIAGTEAEGGAIVRGSGPSCINVGNLSGDWKQPTVRYIGVRLSAGDGVHAAWIRVQNTTSTSSGMRLVDAGYNTQPGEMLAGDAGSMCPRVAIAPVSATIAQGTNLRLVSGVAGHVSSRRWLKDGQPVFDSNSISGSDTDVLTISDAQVLDTGYYRLSVLGSCGTAEGTDATVRVEESCDPLPGAYLVADGPGQVTVAAHPSLDLVDQGTIECWFKIVGGVQYPAARTDACPQKQWVLQYSPNSFPVAKGLTVNLYLDSCKLVTLNWRDQAPTEGWVHIAATIDTTASVARIYFNGTMVKEVTTDSSGQSFAGQRFRAVSAPLLLGSTQSDTVDEFRLWSIARTPAQIAADYTQVVSPSSPGLMVQYSFDDPNRPWKDSTGHAPDGVPTSSVVASTAHYCCAADIDQSGFVDTDDFDFFVNAFTIGALISDMDKTGFVDTDDFDAFIRAFEAGC